MTDRFNNKKFIKKNLINYGFIFKNNSYFLEKTIFDNQFELKIYISDNGVVTTKLIDLSTDEIYTLHLVDTANGAFIGQIKEEYNKILDDILISCFENKIFKESMTLKILDYVKTKYNTTPEYLWEKFPNNAVLRRCDNDKWYGAILTVKGDKIGLKAQEEVEVLNIKINNPIDIIDNKQFFPAYHMNKKYWISVLLNNKTDYKNLKSLIEQSYCLVC